MIVAFQKQSDYEAAVKQTRSDWSPPGELVTSFNSKLDGTFEIWSGNLADPAIMQIVKRIQVLVPLFVEGGTLIDLEDPDVDRWTIFFLYQKKPAAVEGGHPTYIFAGYSTVYRFILPEVPKPLTPPTSPSPNNSTNNEDKTPDIQNLELSDDPDFDISTLPCRTRISQVVIIPPFQTKGLGSRLYRTMYATYYAYAPTVEITIEDPNEDFDDLRDIEDLHFLRTLPEFNALKLNTAVEIPKGSAPAPTNIIDQAAAEAVRRKAKIVTRQFYRVLEMHLMSQLPESVRPELEAPDEEEEEQSSGKGKGKAPAKQPTKEEKHMYNLWRLYVKQRLYRHNKDALGQFEVAERIEKLNDTLSGVEFDYSRLLIKASQREKFRKAEAEAGSQATGGAAANGKRKLDDVADGESEGKAEAGSAKKARVEEAKV